MSQLFAGRTVVISLIIVNTLLYLLDLLTDHLLIDYFGLWPWVPEPYLQSSALIGHFSLWQLLSYSLLHGSMIHLVMNMYALWLFGSSLERCWGVKKFLLFYFFSVLGAGLIQLVIATIAFFQHQYYPTIGASGGVFGLLFAYGKLFPRNKFLLLIPPVTLSARTLVILFIIISVVLAVLTGGQSGIAHFAHLGGMLFGGLLLTYTSTFDIDKDNKQLSDNNKLSE